VTAAARLAVDEVAGLPVARIDGEVDLSNAASLGASLDEAAGDRGLVVDLSSVGFMDSAGLHMLFRLAAALAAHGCGLRVVVPRAAPLLAVLRISDPTGYIPVDETVDAAVAALTGA